MVRAEAYFLYESEYDKEFLHSKIIKRHHEVETIRIQYEREDGIEKYISRITDRHQKAC